MCNTNIQYLLKEKQRLESLLKKYHRTKKKKYNMKKLD